MAVAGVIGVDRSPFPDAIMSLDAPALVQAGSAIHVPNARRTDLVVRGPHAADIVPLRL